MNEFNNLFQSAVFNIDVASYLDVEKNWHNMVNDFKYVRIYYIRSGSAELILTDGDTLKLEEGYLYFIPALSILDGTCKDHMGHYFIHIIPDILTESFFRLLKIKTHCKLEREIADYLFRAIAQNYNKNTFYSQQTTDSALKLILSYFFQNVEFEKTDFAKFTKVFDYIDKHIDEKIQIKDLSALVFLDDVYFSNLFKKTFGISLQAHILQKRTDKAKALLATDATIAEIANTLNFFDAASFTNFFKRQTNMSPKEFRKKLFRN